MRTLTLTLAGVVAGGIAVLLGASWLASVVWTAATFAALVPLAVSVVAAVRRGETGVDVIALLAMASAVAAGEYLAGAVVAVMLSGGQALESFASGRARRDLTALASRVPREADRYTGGAIVTVDLDAVRPGDLLLVKPGVIVPVDGTVEGGRAVVDTSALTGEPDPVVVCDGERVAGGTVNAGGPFDLRAVTTAGRSTYAGIVRLVSDALGAKAPLVRMADRYALRFLVVTIATAGGAWLWSGDPVRAVAVLVVATPCPLILAVPVALISGVSRVARRGLIVKGGGALERLARADVLLLDKTGTLTTGTPSVAAVEAFGDHDPEGVLRLAASLDQMSHHVFAAALVTEARRRGLRLDLPDGADESPGAGISGRVGPTAVRVGSSGYAYRGPLPDEARRLARRAELDGANLVWVSADDRPAGAVVVTDPLRPDAPRTIRALRAAGIRRVVLLTGDHADLAEPVGAAIGADAVLAERSPADKLEAVRAEGGTTLMVGDGFNDAPALAAASVGVALAARGTGAPSDAADAVLTVDRIDRLADAIVIARRSRAIALQSVLAGIGLSLVAMGFAAAGAIAPVGGALLQEAIDVAVIVNALRALRGRTVTAPELTDIGDRFRAEHAELAPLVSLVAQLADRLDALAPVVARAELTELQHRLTAELLPHERLDDELLFPAVARMLGAREATATMSRAHLEISHLVRLLGRLVAALPPSGPGPDDLPDLRRVLYGLHAVLRLHFAQEDEEYLSLIETGP